MVDVPVVHRILNSLNDGLEHLKSKQNVSLEEYKKDYGFTVIFNNVLDYSGGRNTKLMVIVLGAAVEI